MEDAQRGREVPETGDKGLKSNAIRFVDVFQAGSGKTRVSQIYVDLDQPTKGGVS